MGRPGRGGVDGFWDEVRKTDGCWIWMGTSPHGYGAYSWRGKMRGAHRVSYELAFGPIPDGAHVCHRCDNSACVRPDHLFLSDHAGNMADKAAKGKAPSMLGEGNPNVRLTASDVLSIRDRLRNGEPKRALARSFWCLRKDDL